MLFLTLSPDLAQLSQDKYMSVPIKLPAFCTKNTVAYFVFLGELSLGLFLVKDLFRNFGFLSSLAGFSNRTRKTYLATSSLRIPNIAMECLLITECRQTYLAMVTHMEIITYFEINSYYLYPNVGLNLAIEWLLTSTIQGTNVFWLNIDNYWGSAG